MGDVRTVQLLGIAVNQPVKREIAVKMLADVLTAIVNGPEKFALIHPNIRGKLEIYLAATEEALTKHAKTRV